MREPDLRGILKKLDINVVHKNHRGWLVAKFLACLFCAFDQSFGMEFKKIPTHPNYEVSRCGSTVRRLTKGWGVSSGKILSQFNNTNGNYFRVKLADKSVFVHWLVCCAFHGPPPEGMKALHWNDNPIDNRADNLRWGTNQDNSDDASRNGKTRKGVNHPRVKLTLSEVEQIKSLKGSLSERKIAPLFGVSRSTINFIHSGRTWT